MPERRVPAPGVVEALDVFEDNRPHYLTVRPRVAVDQLPLQGRDEALGHRVVVSVGYRSHRRQESCFFEAATELHRGVLATSVLVVNQPRLWPASIDRHVQRIEHEPSPQVVRHGPAYDL